MIATEDTVEILTQEGESGLETVGFSGATTLDIQKRRARPTATTFLYNATITGAIAGVYPLPVAYWGNFITLFDGTIVGGTRLDGTGVGWTNAFPSAYASFSQGDSGNTGLPTLGPMPRSYTYNTMGAKGSNAGIDIFFQTSMTDVDFRLQWVTTTFAFQTTNLVLSNVPQIGNLVPGIISTRRRPEGYNAGEDGVQVFFRPPIAANFVPPNFVDPTTVGVPRSVLVDIGNVNINCSLTP